MNSLHEEFFFDDLLEISNQSPLEAAEKPETEPEPGPELEHDSESGPRPGPEPESEPEHDSESGPRPGPEPESESEPEHD